VFRNVAFTYDNALALLAFLADAPINPDSLRRARLIGDAFVYVGANDRTFTDGRMRSAYAAGDLALPPGWRPKGRSGTSALPGFFTAGDGQFHELLQESSDVGNNAWTLLALLALYDATGDGAYGQAARRIAGFIRSFRNDSGRYGGFQGGYDEPEAVVPALRPWTSSEHNLDVSAAFRALARTTGEAAWIDEAAHAAAFVEAMWDGNAACFLAGTFDSQTRNEMSGQLPLDVQAWSNLAIPETLLAHPDVLRCAEVRHAVVTSEIAGFDFNDDRDGVWLEGTGQMAVAYTFAQQHARAADVRAALRKAQARGPFGDGDGLAAAARDGLTTGFGFDYFRRLHVGASAWNVFAQLRWNPFNQTRARCEPGS
jgi:hypothetical protein